MSVFQLVLTGIFAVAILAGVVAFALFRAGQAPASAQVTMWGSLQPAVVDSLLVASGIEADDSIEVSYTYVDPDEFDTVFIETLARGQTPDLIMLPHDSLLRHRDKIVAIPYESYPARDYRNTFIPEGELFLSASGVLALPVTVDPLVMYWNRTMFNNAGIVSPPRYWDEFFTLANTFTRRDAATGQIQQSAVALGGYNNVTNAKALLSTIIMQAGSPITVVNQNSSVSSVLSSKLNQSVVPAQAALNYYTEFSNPVKTHYSWNPSLPASRDFFSSGDLAVYFGFASEFDLIAAKNPNLDFDVATVPQSRGNVEVITYGNIVGLAIPQATPKANAAFRAAALLTSARGIQEVVNLTNLPPVRRDVLAQGTTNPFLSVMYNSALWARGWLDPSRDASEGIFSDMVQSVTSGRSNISSAVTKASTALQSLLEDKQI